MGFEVKVSGDKKLLAKLAKLKDLFVSQELHTVLEDAKNRMVFMANRFAPKKSRMLANSIIQSSRVENFGTTDVSIRIGSNLPYAIYQEKGTGPRTFGPETKRVMYWNDYDQPGQRLFMTGGSGIRWRVGSVFHFASVVHHPGNPAVPFLKPAVESVKPRLLQAIGRLIREAS